MGGLVLRRESVRGARMKHRACRWLLAGLVCFCACRPVQSQQREVSGFVRSSVNNQPILGATVTLSSDAGETIQQMSPEGSGHFAFSFLVQQVYYVTATAPGHRERRERADLFTQIRVTLQFYLQPEERSSPPTSLEPKIDQRLLRVPEPAMKEYKKGNLLLQQQHDSKASIEHFRKAIQLFPEFAEAYLMLGTAYMDLNQWKDAQEALEKSLKRDEKLAAAHLALGACRGAQGDLAGAEKSLLRGLELKDDAAEGHWELGKVYWAQKRFADAEARAKKAIELRPTLAPAHLLVGNILLQKRDGQGALKSFNEYLRLDPEGPFAATTRDTVAKLEKMLAGTPR